MGGMPAAGTGSGRTAPLSAARLRAAAGGLASLWTDIRVVSATGSTNEDALMAARDGAPEGLVIAAEAQTAGRGRQGRSWQSLHGAALTFSVLLRPGPVPATRGWVPLLAGVAAATALREVTGVDARLKWPNDVMVRDRKLGGILAEQADGAIVVGLGINVRGQGRDLPVATATSLELHGAAETDRTDLLAEILRQLERWYRLWQGAGSGDADACGLRPRYRLLSATIGREVQVRLPGNRVLAGIAADVDGSGQLLVTRADGDLVAISAGDVIHVR